MSPAVVRQAELIAAAARAHGGQFLRATEGDATVSAFTSPRDAALAAIAAARAIDRHSWPEGVRIQVRLALHTDEHLQPTGRYEIRTLNLAARVRDQASAGEVLLSDAAAAALRARGLPPDCQLVNLGPHRLRGIAEPVSLHLLTGPGLGVAAAPAGCPYRGLLPFEAPDHAIFFGREEVLEEVLERTGSGALLAVVGASGSGKSSLLRAGLASAVDRGRLRPLTRVRLTTPGPDPRLEPSADAQELLVVDQFEELFTQCRDQEARERYIDAVLARRAVIGLRADFYSEVSAHPRLAAAVAVNQVLLGPMDETALRRAIAEPARAAGLRLEAGLVDLVVGQVAGQPGALPLMSHALRATWERRDGRTLTIAALHDSGGVAQALSRTADSLLATLSGHERALMRNLFLRLVEVGDGVADTRRRVPVQELIPHDSDADSIRAMLERLADSRLITLDEGTVEVAHEVLIQSWPRLRSWLEEDRAGLRLHRRLTDAARLWELGGREPADLYRGARLDATREWTAVNAERLNALERAFVAASVEEATREERRRQASNRRLRGALALAGILLVVASGLLVLALLRGRDASRAEASARSRALASVSEVELARDPQRALLLARAALAAAATPEAELAASQAIDANTIRTQLPSFGLQGCLTANFLFLIDGGRTAVDNTCDGRIVVADLPRRRIVGAIRVGRSSTDMVQASTPGSFLVGSERELLGVDLRSRHVARLLEAPFTIDQIAHAPGRFTAIASLDAVALADLRTGRLRVIARGDANANAINGMAAAPPHRLIVVTTGQSRGTGNLSPGVTVIDTRNGSRRTIELGTPSSPAAVNFLRVAPDGRTWYFTGSVISAASSRQVASTWAVDPRTGRTIWRATGPPGAIASPIQVSPDSRLVAVGYSSGVSDVLRSGDGQLVIREPSSASIAAGDLTITPDDAALVTVSLDGVLRTWALRGNAQLTLAVPSDPVLGFTPDGRRLVLVGRRGELVDLTSGRVTATYPGFPADTVFNTCPAACAAASPDLRRIAYVDAAGTSPRVDVIDGLTGRRLGGATVPRVDAEAVASDGRIAVGYVAGDRMHAELIDPATRRRRTLPTAASSAGCAAGPPAFTADGRLLAITDGCVHLNVWDVRTGRVAVSVLLPNRLSGATPVLSSDGHFALLAVLGGAILRVGLRDGIVRERPGGRAEGRALAVSRDGRLLAIGRADGSVDEYDSRTLALVRHHLLSAAIQALAFAPDSRRLAIADILHHVEVWDACAVCENPRALAEQAARHTVRALTADERATFGVG